MEQNANMLAASQEQGRAMRWGKVILVAAGPFLIGSSWQLAHSQPDKVAYELQERCGKQAAQTFQKEWGGNVVNTKDGQMLANYESHYSPRLNKCFYLEISTVYQRVNNKMTSFKSLRLFDLNENKEYGSFLDGLGLACEVQGKLCGSEAEWRELAKPFMEE